MVLGRRRPRGEEIWQRTLPGHTIKLTTGIDAHDGFARFGWEMHDSEGKPVTEGMDFAVFGEDGRITRIVGFFGPLPSLDQPPA